MGSSPFCKSGNEPCIWPRCTFATMTIGIPMARACLYDIVYGLRDPEPKLKDKK